MGQKEDGYILDVSRLKQNNALPLKHLKPGDDEENIAMEIHNDVENLKENANVNPDESNGTFPVVNMTEIDDNTEAEDVPNPAATNEGTR